MATPTLWLDKPNAKDELSARVGSSRLLRQVGEQLIDSGFAVLPGLILDEVCDQVVRDFQVYCRDNGDERKHKDANGRWLRVVNLHDFSAAARSIGLNPTIMPVLDFLFGMRACVYTSLYFEYGTQQPIHRDSPFFETFPRNYFVGVWTALEDINPAAGPLMYIPRAHRFECDPQPIYRRVREENPRATAAELIEASLQIYYGEIDRRSSEFGKPVTVPLKKGDVAIWHAQTPHGGSPAVNPNLTRRSIVFHCAPEALQVYQQDVFFSHHKSEAPPPRYDFTEHEERKIAFDGGTAFQLPG